MKTIVASAVLLLAASHTGFGQVDPGQPVKLTSFFNVTQTTVIDNRSPSTRSNNVHLFRAVGTGVFSVQLQYSDTASTGPWVNFADATSLVSNTSSSASGGAFGNHSFLRVLITGTATVQYSGTKNLYIPLSGAGGIVNLATSVTGILPYQNGGGLGASYDIRYSGAVCDGTDQNAAVQAALALGYVDITIPENCTWTVPGALLPPGIIFRGKNWFTSKIQPVASGQGNLRAGPFTQVFNMNWAHTIQAPAGTGPNYDCPNGIYQNLSPVQDDVMTTTCYSGYLMLLNGDNIAGYNLIGTSGWNIRNPGSGDAFFAGTYETNGVSFRGDLESGNGTQFLCDINSSSPPIAVTGGSWAGGNATIIVPGHTYVKNQYIVVSGMNPSGFDGTFRLLTVSGNNLTYAVSNPGAFVAGGTASGDAGGGCFAVVENVKNNSTVPFTWFSTVRTSGNVLQFNHRNTTFTGDVFFVDMADISGSFTGNFIDFYVANVSKFQLDATGTVTVGGFNTVSPLATSSYLGSKNSAVTVPGVTNQNFPTGTTSFLILTGDPGAPFSMGGFTGGTDGRLLKIFNLTGRVMTINNSDVGSTNINRVFIPKGTNYVCPNTYCVVDLIWYPSQWLMSNAN